MLHLRLHESTSQICDNCYNIFFIGHSHLELIFKLCFRGLKLCSGTVSGRRYLQFIHLEIFNLSFFFFFVIYSTWCLGVTIKVVFHIFGSLLFS